MDPVTAIGLASSIITFIDFAYELTSGACEIYKSPNGETATNAQILTVVTDLQAAAASLECGSLGNSVHEQAIASLAQKCQAVSMQLTRMLDNLKIKGTSTRWASIRVAWIARQKAGDVEKLSSQLREYRSQIVLRLNMMNADRGLDIQMQLEQLKLDLSGRTRSLPSDEGTVKAVADLILKQLWFPSMHAREDSVSSAEAGTFNWMLEEDASALDDIKYSSNSLSRQQETARNKTRKQYLDWLREGEQIFHITGKAGSGKSALLRFLARNRHTQKSLQEWAGTKTLVFASFYFWVASGDHLQSSLQGLYRSILHSVIQQCPDLAPEIFATQWRTLQDGYKSGALDADLFRPPLIEKAFENLVRVTCHHPHYRFCFFVDGLDKYRDSSPSARGPRDPSYDFRQLARHLRSWGSGKDIKICSASRPYTEFLDPLAKRGHLVIHIDQLNLHDIYLYSRHIFENDDDFEDFEDTYLDLVRHISKRSEGVFLWAFLTVRVLIPSLARGDSHATLMQKLDDIPEELDTLYDQLLAQVDNRDREKSNLLLRFALYARGSSIANRTVNFSWLDDELLNPEFPSTTRFQAPYTETEMSRRILQVRRRFSSLTKGLLEVENGAHKFSRVAFLHRTAYDYLEQRRKSGLLSCQEEIDFEDLVNRVILANFILMPSSLHDIMNSIPVQSWANRCNFLDRLEVAFAHLTATDQLEQATRLFHICFPMFSITMRKPKHPQSASSKALFHYVASHHDNVDYSIYKLRQDPQLLAEMQNRNGLLFFLHSNASLSQIHMLFDMGFVIRGFVVVYKTVERQNPENGAKYNLVNTAGDAEDGDKGSFPVPAWMIALDTMLRCIHRGINYWLPSSDEMTQSEWLQLREIMRRIIPPRVAGDCVLCMEEIDDVMEPKNDSFSITLDDMLTQLDAAYRLAAFGGNMLVVEEKALPPGRWRFCLLEESGFVRVKSIQYGTLRLAEGMYWENEFDDTCS